MQKSDADAKAAPWGSVIRGWFQGGSAERMSWPLAVAVIGALSVFAWILIFRLLRAV